jgi:hypothetical protein
MRLLYFAVFIGFSFARADQPSRSLATDETKSFHVQIALGQRIVAALARYSKAAYEENGESSNMWTRGISELGLLTRTPTIEVLHAVDYIADSDYALARQYHAASHPVPAGAPATQPLLTMQTDTGELFFDTRGLVTLHCRQ